MWTGIELRCWTMKISSITTPRLRKTSKTGTASMPPSVDNWWPPRPGDRYIPTSTTRSLSQHPLEPHAHGLRCPKFDCPSPWKKPLHSTLMQVLSRKTGYGTMRQWAAPSYSLTTLPHSAHTASTRVMLCTTVPTPTPITTSLLVASYPQDIKITVTTAPMQTCTSPTTATMKGMWMQ